MLYANGGAVKIVAASHTRIREVIERLYHHENVQFILENRSGEENESYIFVTAGYEPEIEKILTGENDAPDIPVSKILLEPLDLKLQPRAAKNLADLYQAKGDALLGRNFKDIGDTQRLTLTERLQKMNEAKARAEQEKALEKALAEKTKRNVPKANSS
jgi:hypothetical protein